MKKFGSFLLTGVLAQASSGADIELTIEIPRLPVAEYHRPYIAAWIEEPDHGFVANLAVWYDVALANEEGETWLKDLRQWWRRSGRNLDMPVDGVSGPTRPPGTHTLRLSKEHPGLATLPRGTYNLVVEAAREVGGRELVRIPFTWEAGALEATAQGKTELGTLQLTIP